MPQFRIADEWDPIAVRSGFLADMEPVPIAIAPTPPATPTPTDSPRTTEQRVATRETSRVTSAQYAGANSAASDGTGIGDRVIIGVLPAIFGVSGSGGRYGIRVLDSAGRRRVQSGEQDDGKYGYRMWD